MRSAAAVAGGDDYQRQRYWITFQQPIPADMANRWRKSLPVMKPGQGRRAVCVFSDTLPTDAGVYMRAAQPGREHDIANYNATPIKMNAL